MPNYIDVLSPRERDHWVHKAFVIKISRFDAVWHAFRTRLLL